MLHKVDVFYYEVVLCLMSANSSAFCKIAWKFTSFPSNIMFLGWPGDSLKASLGSYLEYFQNPDAGTIEPLCRVRTCELMRPRLGYMKTSRSEGLIAATRPSTRPSVQAWDLFFLPDVTLKLNVIAFKTSRSLKDPPPG